MVQINTIEVASKSIHIDLGFINTPQTYSFTKKPKRRGPD